MTSSCYDFQRPTNDVNTIRILLITVSVTVSLIKIQLLMILKKWLLTELKKNKKKSKGNAFFFGRACLLIRLNGRCNKFCISPAHV